ncbi:C39 family peptidase [Mycoplasma sp. P36-A1]|uniref:C39 family peptidase n=1 Tax=Mycoplasma sp. P36-A1 TaxID=3252900 RepID=UPI003C2C39A1
MKKLIVVLTVFYCALLLNINVQANANGVISEEIIQSEQELLFQEQVEQDIKYLETVEVFNDKLRVITGYSGIKVPYVKQKNHYYCGPATVLQTQRYFYPKTASTQDSLAKSLKTTTAGTSYSMIRTVLNSRSYISNKYRFVNITKFSEQTLVNYIGTVVGVQKRPVILNIGVKKRDVSAYDRLGYHTNGHFLNASKAKGKRYSSGMQEVSLIELVDPYNEYGKKSSKGIVKVKKDIARVIIRNQPAAAKMILV